MFKYQLGQTIYFLEDNKIYSAPILSRAMVENLHEDWDATNEQKNFYKPFGNSGISYSVCHGVINEENAFSSKEELVNNLIK